MRILAFMAHPDDAVFTCGGTLAKHADRGDDVMILYATRGEWGGDTSEDKVAERREQESRNCAEVLGASVDFLGQKDGRVTDDLDDRFTAVDAIRRHKPDTLITWYHDDPHPDHRIVGQLAQDASFQAASPLLETEAEPCSRPEIYFVGKPQTSFDPTTYVDVSSFQDQKESALLEHESQVQWIEETRERGKVEDILHTWGRAYGQECDVEYAEGFISRTPNSVEYLG